MQAAAEELRFETAGKIKQFIDQLQQLGKGALRHVRRIEEALHRERYRCEQLRELDQTKDAFLSAASHGTDHLIVQRLLATRSLRDARAALIGSGIVVFGEFLLFLLVGVTIWFAWPEGHDVLKRWRKVADPDRILVGETYVLEPEL